MTREIKPETYLTQLDRMITRTQTLNQELTEKKKDIEKLPDNIIIGLWTSLTTINHESQELITKLENSKKLDTIRSKLTSTKKPTTK